MTIPNGYGRLSWVLGGEALPHGGVVTLGLDLRSAAGAPSSWLGTLLAEPCQGLFEDVCTNDVSLLELTLKLGPEDTGPTYNFPVGEAGHGSGNAPPPQVAMLVKELVSDVTGRLGGRMFWPGFDRNNALQDGTLSGSSAYQGVFNDFYDALAEVDISPVVLTSMPEGPRAVAGFGVAATLATQRRRLRR